MGVIPVVVRDRDGRDLMMTDAVDFSVAFGVDDNEITIEGMPGAMPPDGGFAYIDGTEYGGVVDVRETAPDGFTRCVGRSWHGILAGKRLVPPPGESHISVDAPARDAVEQVLKAVGLDGLFTAGPGSKRVVYRFDRFVDAYTGLRGMMKANGLKMRMVYTGGRVVVSGEPVDRPDVASEKVDFTISTVSRTYNHLVCAGGGENENRKVVHFFADASGKVSKEQSLFGVDEITAFYDYPNASDDELEYEGRRKLEDMQGDGSIEASVREGVDAEIGDVLMGMDSRTGESVAAEVTKKTVRVSGGSMTVEYEAGTVTRGTSGSTVSGGPGGSGGGGHAYYAGRGLTLTGYTFDADVTSSDLGSVSAAAESAAATAAAALSEARAAQSTADGKAPSVHQHAASDVSSGVLPIERGGTGGSSAAAAQYSLLGSLRDTTDAVRDSTKMVYEYDVPDETKGTVCRKTAVKLWEYIKSKADALYAASKHSHLYASSASPGGPADSSLACSGNADTASRLMIPRTIRLSGAVSGSASFDGSGDVTISTSIGLDSAGFAAAHPVGSYFETESDVDPSSIAGSWTRVDVAGRANLWRRDR